MFLLNLSNFSIYPKRHTNAHDECVSVHSTLRISIFRQLQRKLQTLSQLDLFFRFSEYATRVLFQLSNSIENFRLHNSTPKTKWSKRVHEKFAQHRKEWSGNKQARRVRSTVGYIPLHFAEFSNEIAYILKFYVVVELIHDRIVCYYSALLSRSRATSRVHSLFYTPQKLARELCVSTCAQTLHPDHEPQPSTEIFRCAGYM